MFFCLHGTSSDFVSLGVAPAPGIFQPQDGGIRKQQAKQGWFRYGLGGMAWSVQRGTNGFRVCQKNYLSCACRQGQKGCSPSLGKGKWLVTQPFQPWNPGTLNPTDNLSCTKKTGLSRWWQLKYFLIFTPKIGEDEPILTYIIFFKWVGEKPPTQPFSHIQGMVNHPMPMLPPSKAPSFLAASGQGRCKGGEGGVGDGGTAIIT